MKTDPLANVRLSFQCPMDWEAMKGDETKRFCEQCQKHVHNLQELSESEARRVLCSGNACVRMITDEKGRVITKRTMAAAAAIALASAALSSCAKSVPTMGVIACPPEKEAN